MNRCRSICVALFLCTLLSACSIQLDRLSNLASSPAATPDTGGMQGLADSTPEVTGSPSVVPVKVEPTPSGTPATASTGEAATDPVTTPSRTLAPGQLIRYYVVQQGNRQSVIDSLGRVVLAPEFASIEILSTERMDPDAPADGPTAFFAVPSVVYNTYDVNVQSFGYLYDTEGRKLSEELVIHAYALNDDAIAVCRPDRNEYLWGLVGYDGSVIIPTAYSMVQSFTDGYLVQRYHESGKSRLSATYTKDGKLIAQIDKEIWSPDGVVILQTDENGKRLVDRHFHVLGDALWTDFWPLADDRYAVTTADGMQGIVDGNGNVIIAPVDGNIWQCTKEETDEYYTVVYRGGNVALLDGKDNVLFLGEGYDSITYADNVIVVSRGELGWAFDRKGKELLPGVDTVSMYLPQEKLFSVRNRDAAGNVLDRWSFLYPDGSEFPHSADGGIYWVGEDRYIVYAFPKPTGGFVSDFGFFGLADYKGNWILNPVYERMDNIGDGLIAVGRRDKTGLLQCGIVDTNGHEVVPLKFDSLYGYGGDLLQARRSTRYGLVDRQGNWVWSASDYSTLVD